MEPQDIVVRTGVDDEGNKTYYLDGEFPEQILVDPEVLAYGEPKLVETTIRFTFANGSATYRVIDKKGYALTCQLVEKA